MGTLRRGDKGREVARLQDLLRGLGAAIDDEPGEFGLSTEAAVYLLQHDEGLVADGVVGPVTLDRLRSGPRSLSSTETHHLIAGVPYLSQRDNEHRPHATCNVTALAMALLHHGVSAPSGGQLEDELYELLDGEEGRAYYEAQSPDLFRAGVPPQEVYDNLVWAARRYGLDASFSQQRSLQDIEAEIAADRPVLLSGLFTGSGHIVLLAGLTARGDLICHDPYGDWNRGYRDRCGAARIYERDRARAVLKKVGSDEKWGLFLWRR